MNIRPVTLDDKEDIQHIYFSAFSESENDSVARLAIELLNEHSSPEIISLVAEREGEILGHVAFSPVRSVDDRSFLGYILAPLAVKPNEQKQGVGSGLIKYGLHYLFQHAVSVVFVYGDPDYYGRFGFNADLAQQFTAPYALEYPFGWQAIELNTVKKNTPPLLINCVTALSKPELW